MCVHTHPYIDTTASDQHDTLHHIRIGNTTNLTPNAAISTDGATVTVHTTTFLTPGAELILAPYPTAALPQTTNTQHCTNPPKHYKPSKPKNNVNGKRTAPVILEPTYAPNTRTFTWDHLQVQDTHTPQGHGVFSTTFLKRGTYIPHLGTPIPADTLQDRKHAQMALTNALNWNQDLPTREKITQITSALTHTNTYSCIQGAIDGHPSISPHNNIGSRGIAITMMINEPMTTKPNAILAADGIILTSNIPSGTQIQAFYGNSYEELRKLQGYTITTNSFFHTEMGM